MQFCQLVLGALVVVDVVLRDVNGDDGNFFLKAAKSVPRIGRSGKNANEDMFEKFFLKASKSVPRIGRRGPPQTSWNDDNYNVNNVNNMKYPLWSEISDRFESDPELFTYPHLLQQLEQALGDDPSVYDIDKVRMKRTNMPPKFATNKEIVEYRLQPINYV